MFDKILDFICTHLGSAENRNKLADRIRLADPRPIRFSAERRLVQIKPLFHKIL